MVIGWVGDGVYIPIPILAHIFAPFSVLRKQKSPVLVPNINFTHYVFFPFME